MFFDSPLAYCSLLQVLFCFLTFERWPQDVVAPCKVVAEIAVMLVEEIEIDGESLTASLPWYVLDAVCCVYTCQRLIDLSLIAGTKRR